MHARTPDATNRSKPAAPPAGILCPNCGRPACGRATAAARRQIKAKRGATSHKVFVDYVRYRPAAIHRVRICPHCDRRFLTAERIISNGT